MTFLDTHVVVWLYAGLADKFTEDVQNLLNDSDIFISPITRLELQYLFETDRISVAPDEILRDLRDRIGLAVSELNFETVVGEAIQINWTCDPFDRIIVAQASLYDSILITKDRTIIAKYPHARW